MKKGDLEYLRQQAKQRFDKVRSTWIDIGQWVAPHRVRYMLSQTEGERKNNHIVDTTHLTAHRSFVAGHMEGNTSATRPWFKIGTGDMAVDLDPQNKEWLDLFSRYCLRNFARSNFYLASTVAYGDYGTFNTAGYFIEELQDRLHYHVLTPGAYFVLNNGLGEPVVLIVETILTVKALVEEYARKREGGGYDWSNISSEVKDMYDKGVYGETVMTIRCIKENDDFDPEQPIGGENRRWVSYTYELAGNSNEYLPGTAGSPDNNIGFDNKGKYLRVSYHNYKPFVIPKTASTMNFEYGEVGPSLSALGCIKSLNKKALSKDQAIEQTLRPTLQGPAGLKKSYITTQSNRFIPLDAMSDRNGGLRSVFQVGPEFGVLVQDVGDLRQQVNELYFADYLLYLSRNPKTRTATEAAAVVQEQQLVIGPNLQFLNYSQNVPLVEHIMEYTLDNEPELPPIPSGLAGRFIKPEFISVFAQAQRAADLPQVERYLAMVQQVGQINPQIFDKVNLDKIADIYEDRLYLPAGVNRPQDMVDAKREQAQAMAQRQQQLEAMTQMSKAAGNVGMTVNQGEPEE